MIGDGVKQRQLFMERMQAVAIGATLRRRSAQWTVVKQKRAETGVVLTLKCRRREIRVHVPVCISGPVLWEVDLHPVAPPPSQCELVFPHVHGSAE